MIKDYGHYFIAESCNGEDAIQFKKVFEAIVVKVLKLRNKYLIMKD